MFQAKANLNVSSCNEGDNRKEKRKKKHISSKRKHHSRHSHSKHSKRWDLNINNPHLKHANYTSDYIGPERLTKHLLGFLGKGKISDSISRLEKIMPENCKARSKHDLDRILNVSSGEIQSYNQDYLLHTNENCNSSQDGSSLSPPSPVSNASVRKSSAIGSSKQKSNFSVNLETGNSTTSSRNSPSPLCTKYDATVICREVITKKLHCAVSDANKTVYPNVSNQKRLTKELLNLKNEYNSCKKALSSSNNCDSSQDTRNTCSLESPEKNDFKLNPILTQESPIAKSLENMFPDSQNLSSNSDSDSVLSDDSELFHTNDVPLPHYHNETKLSVSSSGREGSLVLIPSSPVSSGGSPVWAPESSPMKFLHDTLPTPKLFYRQKMF